MTSAIRITGLVKDYGSTRALDGVDLDITSGEVFGFLGPNGAGKSTTIRVLLDLLRPTAGSVEVLGLNPRSNGPALRARIGYLPGELNLPAHATAGAYLRYLSDLRSGAGRAAIGPIAERFGLDLTRSMRALSKGNKQKVGIVQAFMHDPELLILDEPTSGLDPLLQHEFIGMVNEASARGATVFMSSHVLAEVEETARRIAIIRDGRIVDVDEVAALRHRAGQIVELRFATDGQAPTVAEFAVVAGVTEVSVDGHTLRCELHGPPDALLRASATRRVEYWSATDRELEDLFMSFYRSGPAAESEVHGAR